jgi:outer membrane protein assembly factor BamE (lipoprotein component of BamABCDE complex)
MKFDQTKWNKNIDGIYEYRENMVADLMQNHLKNGMDYKKVIELLGEPENYHNKKTNEIIYEIMVDYGWNIDPVEGKELHLEFDKDSIITKIKLEHWKH